VPVAVDPAELRAEFDSVVTQVLAEARLSWPDLAGLAGVSGQAGRDGVHTEAMGFLLAELQSVARAMPGATW
jgi:ring-1,2-phenylacetyl-CoA epoxidase subunit PaaC